MTGTCPSRYDGAQRPLREPMTPAADPACLAPDAGDRAFARFLLFTAGITGALVMVVEVLGSRVIGPFFGVSLFVWTALITVTLLALAAGYALGGMLVDRHASPALLYAIVMAAGALVALVPWLKPFVLKAALPLGLRAGSLAASAALFGPALLLLGCVSPFVVRLAAREWTRLGRTVGLFYAVSTAGSFAGTLCAGYLVIGYVGVSLAFHLAGLTLVALGAAYFAFFRRRWLALLAPAVAIAAWPGGELPSVRLADGTLATVVHAEDSFYGHIRVVEYSHGATRTRELVIDGLVQGGVDVANGLSIYEYSYLLQSLPVALHPAGRSCLVIGVGAGVVPSWYEARGIATDVVDIDPRVVEAARRFFGYRPAGNVHLEDARYFLSLPGRRYDFVILDVFTGDTTPGHLLSVEALRLARSRLNPGGVLAVNLVGAIGPDAQMTGSVVATLRAVFDTVRVHPAFDPAQGATHGNLVLLAHDGPARGPVASPSGPVHPLAEKIVRFAQGRTLDLPSASGAPVLTDDFNPLDVRDIAVKERVRRQILETTDPDILIRG